MSKCLFLKHEERLGGGDTPTIHLCGYETSESTACVFAVPLTEYEPVLRSRFALFDVTKTVLEWVFAAKPERVVLDQLCTDSVDVLRLLNALGVGVQLEQTNALTDTSTGSVVSDLRWAAGLNEFIPSEFQSTGALANLASGEQSLGYEMYALSARNHNLLIRWAERVLPFFAHRQSVLDLGCGTGVFLDQLKRQQIPAQGVDSNEPSVCYASLLGLDVTRDDGAAFLAANQDQFDAIHCSHLVEHLDWESLTQTMSLIAGALQPGGIAVLVFPDPESIRSQLLGFWRDPDHKRFYHPDAVSMLGRTFGLLETHNSQHEPGRSVAPFTMAPPELDTPSLKSFYPASDQPSIQDLAANLQKMVARLDQQEQWIRQLWAVNQTWAWADDALLVLTKQ